MVSQWRSDLRLFRDRPFSLLFAARTASTLGSAFAPVALAFAVLALPQGSPGLLSLVLACESIPLVVFLLVGGVLADQFPRARVLLVGELLSVAAFAALGAMMLVGFTPTWALGTAAALSGTGMAIVGPAVTGLIPEVVPPTSLQTGNALLGFGASAARILGVVVSGAVVAAVGGAWALVVGGAVFGVAASVVALLPRGAGRGDQLSARGVWSDLREGWAEFVSHEWLWVVVLQWSFLILLFNAAHGVLGPVIADAELGGPVPWSWVLAGESAGMVLGVLVALRLRPRRPILLPVLLVVPTLPTPFLLLGLGAPLPWVIATAFLAGAAMSIFGVLWNTTMQREVPPEALSRVSSYDALGSFMFGPIGLLVAGPAAAAFGARPAMVACGVALALVTVAPLVSRDVRTLGPGEPARRRADPEASWPHERDA